MIKIGTKDWLEYRAQIDAQNIASGGLYDSYSVEGFYDWLADGKPKLAAKVHVKHL